MIKNVILTSLIMLIAFVVLIGNPLEVEPEVSEPFTHRVKNGDTLWSIADEYVGKEFDKRKWIYEMDIDPMLRPGQKIKIVSWK
jgi:nucleoid-associated protein YgaU